MERKNTILLTVIAVATLLVAVVGATFAYFTASINSAPSVGGTATATTTSLSSVNLSAETTGTFNQADYPGGYIVIGMRVYGGGSDITAQYNLTGSISTTIGSESNITWAVYEVPAGATGDLVSGCDYNTVYEDYGYYSYGTTCALNQAFTPENRIASGTVTSGSSIDLSTAVNSESLTLSSTSTAETYYYLVVHYEESGSDQGSDQGQTITASLTGLDNITF